MSLVSIIVPVYNVEKTLERCVRSLQSQTLQDIEIILVDDGSKDASGAIADRLAAKDKRIRVLHKENEGLGLTRNAGLRLAKGDYVGFVDSDDYVDAQMYEKLFREAEQTRADAVYGGYLRVYDGQISSKIEFDTERVYRGREQLMELMLSMLACPRKIRKIPAMAPPPAKAFTAGKRWRRIRFSFTLSGNMFRKTVFSRSIFSVMQPVLQ